MGKRPSDFTPELAEALLDEVAEGSSFRQACEKFGIPRRSARAWVARNPEFRAAYEAARFQQLDHHADALIELADQAVGKDAAGVQAIRLAVDTRRWVLSKLVPRVYGDRMELTGENGAALIPATREQRLPGLVAVLGTLLPAAENSQLFELAGRLLDRLGNDGAPALTQLDPPGANGVAS